MTHPVPRVDVSLFDILAARARAESDGRLVIDVLAGILIVVPTALLRFTLWPMVIGSGICLISYGLWGISDRELQDHASNPRSRAAVALTVTRGVCVAVGCMAGLLVAFGGLRILLGTWIS